MKKIILLCLVASTFLTAGAQTKKSKKSKKAPNKEAVAKARFNKQEIEKKLLRDSLVVAMRTEDSVRVVTDSISDLQKESESLAYRENGLKAIDSMNKEKYVTMAAERMESDKAEKVQSDISQTVKLSETTKKQVKIVNTSYTEKAKLLLNDNGGQQKVTELIALNAERRDKLKAIVGKSKERKLEKERKEYIAKNGIDKETAWMDIGQPVAKK